MTLSTLLLKALRALVPGPASVSLEGAGHWCEEHQGYHPPDWDCQAEKELERLRVQPNPAPSLATLRLTRHGGGR